MVNFKSLRGCMKKQTKKQPKQKTPPQERNLSKEDFFKSLDKVIGVVKQKSSSKGKKKTSE
jgi:hypothetical protein